MRDCIAARMAQLIAEADDEDEIDLSRHPMVTYYMDHFDMKFPEAVELLEQERDLRWTCAVEAMSRRHDLDEDAAVSHVLTHAVNQPEMIQ
jgi:hypothetical protein